MSTPSVLLIGSTGHLGVQIIREAARLNLPLHAFARTPSKLGESDAHKCLSVIQGDALNATDVTTALTQSGASVVIVSIGSGNSLGKTDIRRASMRVLVDVLKEERFKHVRVVVVSSVGAGGTKIDIGMGVGSLLAWVLRNVMRDHDGQEEVFRELGRGVVVRPVGLGRGKGGREVVEFEGRAKRGMIDRVDVARYVVGRVLAGRLSGEVNICSG